MEIKSPNKLIPGQRKDCIYVFCGGPIQGAPDWQRELPEIDGVCWVNPKRENLNGFDWNKQVEWETIGLRVSDIILFWIPPMVEEIPGQDYAQTTKIEFMENLVRGKKIILGISEEIHTRRYLVQKANDYGVKNVFNNLEDCIKEIKEIIKEKRSSSNIFFTSDTHFSQERTLTLSKRPFSNTKEMDFTMIERWNKVVSPYDTVYHLGDFGNLDMLKYLNGKIIFLKGNYEKDEENLPFDEIVEYNTPIKLKLNDKFEVSLVHRPLLHDGYTLFGHIHGRQKVKKFGLDVGVDCNNFTPVSKDEVLFYFNAIDKKYYDEDVFC